MSYTADQLSSLREAYASGVLEVTYSDGRRVRYQSMADMAQAIVQIERSLTPAAQRITHYNPVFDKGV